jgi:hypothetical protein
MHVGASYTKLVFLHLVGSVGHIVHLRCETLTHYFSHSSGPGAVSRKSAVGNGTPNLCFYIQWDL